MATRQLKEVIDTLCQTAGPTDGQLLESYIRSRDEAAIAALVRRHGPMVWGVCRRVLHNYQDAEDAFQTTFLVLVRKAASVVPREMVANWLYGVAHQTALKARARTAKRLAREKQVIDMPEPEATPQQFDDLQTLLDRELSRLPDKYRAVIVLCDLDGKTRKEAARQLQVPEGTVASRHSTARAMLARRLARSGLVPAVLATSFASASVPLAVVSSTIQAAAHGIISANAAALAEGVMKTMLLNKLKTVGAVVLMVVALGAGAAGLMQQGRGETPSDKPAAEKKDAPDSANQEKKEADWPQWRGPNRDGVVRGVAVPAKWPKLLKEEWTVPVGKGAGSPVVVDGKIYLLTRQKNDDEIVQCFDLRKGKVIWESEPYPAPYKVGPGEGTADDRPRSTPAVADGRVFTLGMTGILSAFDAKSGKLLWRKDTNYVHYMGSSPMVVDGMCIACVGDGARVGGLTAFDAKTGELRWCFREGGGGLSGSPIVVDLVGERQVVTYSAWNPAGVSLAKGKMLWGVGPGGAGMPCTTPVQYKDTIILADNLDSLRALRLEKTDKRITAKEVWKSKDDLKLYYSSPVIADDLVFGMSTKNGGCFFCLDAKTGKTKWESEGRQGGYASIVSLGSVLLYLKDRGQLLVVKPSGTAFEPIAEYRVSDRSTMAHPVFLGDRLLIKDDITLKMFRIEPHGK